MRNYRDNIIVKLTFQFALDVMNLSEKLKDQRGFAFADQLLRSGCSVGANVKEAQSAESKADFIHKLKIASKEVEETEYWLELCQYDENYPKPGKLLTDVESILKVLAKIVTTSRKGRTSPIEN